MVTVKAIDDNPCSFATDEVARYLLPSRHDKNEFHCLGLAIHFATPAG